jgi:hypothetical protein
VERLHGRVDPMLQVPRIQRFDPGLMVVAA